MCFINDDGPAAVWDESVRKARKRHRCNECSDGIEPGEHYLRIGCLVDGSWSTLRVCARCWWDHERVHQHELAEGCREHEAHCPIGELREHMAELRRAAVRYDDDDNPVVTADWSPSPITYRGERLALEAA